MLVSINGVDISGADFESVMALLRASAEKCVLEKCRLTLAFERASPDRSIRQLMYGPEHLLAPMKYLDAFGLDFPNLFLDTRGQHLARCILDVQKFCGGFELSSLLANTHEKAVSVSILFLHTLLNSPLVRRFYTRLYERNLISPETKRGDALAAMLQSYSAEGCRVLFNTLGFLRRVLSRQPLLHYGQLEGVFAPLLVR
jgi:hypothetical protein